MSTQNKDSLEQLIDEHMSALVESYIGNPSGIPKKEIQAQLEKAYQDASDKGLITKEEFQDLIRKEEIMESIPQEAKIGFENKGKVYVPKVHPDVIKEYEEGIEAFKEGGFLKEAENMHKRMMKKCYDEVEDGKITTIPQPDKIVGTGKFKPSKLDKVVDKVMGGREVISVPEFKETVWQKIKNFLHIGKGHEARKQEHTQKFVKDNIKAPIPEDVMDKAKSIGAKAKAENNTISPPNKSFNKQVGRSTTDGHGL